MFLTNNDFTKYVGQACDRRVKKCVKLFFLANGQIYFLGKSLESLCYMLGISLKRLKMQLKSGYIHGWPRCAFFNAIHALFSLSNL